MLYSIELRSRWSGLKPGIVLFGGGLLYRPLRFLDTGFLAGEVAEIEDAGPADLTNLVHLDLVDERAFVRENPLDTDAVGDLTDGKSPGIRGSSTNLDNYAAEILKSVLVTFFNPVGHGNGIAGLELRIGGCFILREGFLHQFNQIHSIISNILAASLNRSTRGCSIGTANVVTFFQSSKLF